MKAKGMGGTAGARQLRGPSFARRDKFEDSTRDRQIPSGKLS